MELKIEAGKFYRTRGGKKAFVAYVGNPFSEGNEQEEAIGWVEKANGYRESWCRDGKFYRHRGLSEYDLVAEWKEPKRIKGWLNVYLDEDNGSPTVGMLNKSKSECPKDTGRVACIGIDVLEGEGLEDVS